MGVPLTLATGCCAASDTTGAADARLLRADIASLSATVGGLGLKDEGLQLTGDAGFTLGLRNGGGGFFSVGLRYPFPFAEAVVDCVGAGPTGFGAASKDDAALRAATAGSLEDRWYSLINSAEYGRIFSTTAAGWPVESTTPVRII